MPSARELEAPPAEAEPKQPMKDRNAEVDFHGQKRANAAPVSTSDPNARLYCKGKGKEKRSSATRATR